MNKVCGAFGLGGGGVMENGRGAHGVLVAIVGGKGPLGRPMHT